MSIAQVYLAYARHHAKLKFRLEIPQLKPEVMRQALLGVAYYRQAMKNLEPLL